MMTVGYYSQLKIICTWDNTSRNGVRSCIITFYTIDAPRYRENTNQHDYRNRIADGQQISQPTGARRDWNV